MIDPSAGSQCNFNSFYPVILASIKTESTWTTFDIDLILQIKSITYREDGYTTEYL